MTQEVQRLLFSHGTNDHCSKLSQVVAEQTKKKKQHPVVCAWAPFKKDPIFQTRVIVHFVHFSLPLFNSTNKNKILI